MSRLRRVVFDTGTLVSAALRTASAHYLALGRALGACEVCASKATLAELEQATLRKKLVRRLDAELRLSFVALMRSHASVNAVEKTHAAAAHPACRGPGDDLFLALAAKADAPSSGRE